MSAVAVVAVLYNRKAVAAVKLCAVVTLLQLQLFDSSLIYLCIAHRENFTANISVGWQK